MKKAFDWEVFLRSVEPVTAEPLGPLSPVWADPEYFPVRSIFVESLKAILAGVSVVAEIVSILCFFHSEWGPAIGWLLIGVFLWDFWRSESK